MEAMLSPASDEYVAAVHPVNQTERIETLDVLRGVALLGILLMSIQAFGLTEASVQQLVRNPHGGNYWLVTLVHVLFENKMRALFSMLFGAGILLFLNKSRSSSGMEVPELFIRRQLWLIVFGLINAWGLLWHYDILFHYGIVGIFLFPFMRLSPRTLLVCAVAVGLIYSGKLYWQFAEQKQKYEKFQQVTALEKKNKKVKLTDEQKDDKSAWEGMVKGRQYDSKADKADVVAMRSDYATVWSHQLPKTKRMEASFFYQFGLWDIVSMMLLGMALFKWGFFSNRLTTRHYTFLAIGGILIGQAMAWFSLSNHELAIVNFTRYVSTNSLPVAEVLMPFERAFVAIGWASLVLLAYRSGRGAWLWKALSAVGQMAFTNYLMQSMLCTLFFYGYGLGYYGDMKLYQLYIVVAEIWLIQLVFSLMWLKTFRLGPLEWLWRSLTYGRRQPMLRTETSPQVTPVFS
ncbi:DUF418 domain-containing protein [Spirosoma utsteinense]|uniref:DUF418 domain-containing protein n=1 Tax=Spirosoma utsteinense TaxID=2585773 RepID=A0ABR6W981_9BACT|nr:DUF418 domain-containing protein [Spirosoma utsteinense]MBC3787971.1 hypothetical protein [Spirosoma utsteinense]MBC3793124.1 hypothetical protein [Spirosoma utsteinense]